MVFRGFMSRIFECIPYLPLHLKILQLLEEKSTNPQKKKLLCIIFFKLYFLLAYKAIHYNKDVYIVPVS